MSDKEAEELAKRFLAMLERDRIHTLLDYMWYGMWLVAGLAWLAYLLFVVKVAP